MTYNIITPKTQTRAPILAWLINEISANIGKISSHDNISHSLLGLFNIEIKIYDKKMDLFKYFA